MSVRLETKDDGFIKCYALLFFPPKGKPIKPAGKKPKEKKVKMEIKTSTVLNRMFCLHITV